MLPRHTTRTLLILFIVIAGVYTAFFLPWRKNVKKETEVLKKKAGIPKVEMAAVGWKNDFSRPSSAEGEMLPAGWQLQGKPGTKATLFSVNTDPSENVSLLHMEADKASASLITDLRSVDLKKTPIMRWRWRVTALPEGADGRTRAKDDQAIGIYVGTGSALNNKSVSYRWDTETPKGSEGNSAYGLGTIKVKWYTLRNKDDAKGLRWFTEERNVARDFVEAWGFYPEEIYLSVSCNSQYTGSHAAADVDWIEFVSKSTK